MIPNLTHAQNFSNGLVETTSPVGGFYCVRWKLSQDEGPESSPGMAFFWELKPERPGFFGKTGYGISDPLFLRQKSRDLQRLESKKNHGWNEIKKNGQASRGSSAPRPGAWGAKEQRCVCVCVCVKHRRFHLITLITPDFRKKVP